VLLELAQDFIAALLAVALTLPAVLDPIGPVLGQVLARRPRPANTARGDARSPDTWPASTRSANAWRACARSADAGAARASSRQLRHSSALLEKIGRGTAGACCPARSGDCCAAT